LGIGSILSPLPYHIKEVGLNRFAVCSKSNLEA
jgi:hypothetical protein